MVYHEKNNRYKTPYTILINSTETQVKHAGCTDYEKFDFPNLLP